MVAGYSRFVDCRKCVFFIRFDDLDDELKEKATEQAAWRGGEPLGWCKYFNRVVTYYRGYCSAYTPKQINQQSLKKYIPGL